MKTFSNLCEEYTDIVYIHFMQEINEKFGAYNGQIEFVNAIVDFIMSEISDMGNNKSEVSFSINGDDLIKEGFENIFFDTIEIVYNETVKTGYISRNNFNEQTKRLKYVFIGITPSDPIRSTLTHELTHAWEDYSRQLSGKLSISDLISSSNYKYIHNSTNCNYVDICKRIEYQLTSFEINGYLSELSVTLENEHINDFKDAIAKFKQDDTWKNYTTLYNLINQLDENNLKKLTDAYNQLMSTSFTPNKLLKKLNNRFEKVINKILTNIPKIYYDHYMRTNEGLCVNPGNNFIERLKRMNNYTKPNYITMKKYIPNGGIDI